MEANDYGRTTRVRSMELAVSGRGRRYETPWSYASMQRAARVDYLLAAEKSGDVVALN